MVVSAPIRSPARAAFIASGTGRSSCQRVVIYEPGASDRRQRVPGSPEDGGNLARHTLMGR